MNYKQIKSVYQKRKENENKILEVCPNCPKTSGIYFLLREEYGFKFAYIGQSVNLLQRLAYHLQGYQHIDLSIKKHGLWSEDNQTGYKVHFLTFPKEQLDEMEQKYIKQYANAGYQLRNVTSGSQGQGKKSLGTAKQPKTYTEGVVQGEKNMAKRIKHLFDLHLDYAPKKNPPTKLQEKALKKFKEILEYERNEE